MGQKVTGSTRTYSLSQNFKKAQPLGNIPLLSSTEPSNFRGVHTLCIQNVFHISTNFCTYTFCIQNLAVIDLLVLYTKCIQRFVKMWDKFCIHFVNIHCIHVAQSCIQNVMHGFCVLWTLWAYKADQIQC